MCTIWLLFKSLTATRYKYEEISRIVLKEKRISTLMDPPMHEFANACIDLRHAQIRPKEIPKNPIVSELALGIFIIISTVILVVFSTNNRHINPIHP